MKSFFIFALSLALFTVGLSGQEIISFDTRFYLFALEMWRHGVSWFPTTYGQPYPDYPVASTLLIYVSSLLFGGLNKFTAVLPSAVAAALAVLMTYKIGQQHQRKIGLYAVFMLIATLAFFKSARGIALDMYPTLITACCFYLVDAASVKASSRKWWIYPLFVLSFIFRGPIGLVMPTGVVCVYYLLDGKFKQSLLTGCYALLLLVACSSALLMLAYHAGGNVFLQDVLRMEVMGRMGSQFLPLYFYFTDSLLSYALSYPFALIVMFGVAGAVISRKTMTDDTRFLLKLTGWVLVIMLGMTVPGDKKVRYILPMAPALALLAASLWTLPVRSRYMALAHHFTVFFFLLLPGMLAVATGYLWYLSAGFGLTDFLSYSSLIIFFIAMQIASLYFYLTDDSEGRLLWVIFFAAACFVATNIFIIEPIEIYVDRTRGFVQAIEEMRLHKQARLAFYRENVDGLPIKYLANMPMEEQPLFIADEAALQLQHEAMVIVTSHEYFERLPPAVRAQFVVIGQGQVGHVKVIVFERVKKHVK